MFLLAIFGRPKTARNVHNRGKCLAKPLGSGTQLWGVWGPQNIIFDQNGHSRAAQMARHRIKSLGRPLGSGAQIRALKWLLWTKNGHSRAAQNGPKQGKSSGRHFGSGAQIWWFGIPKGHFFYPKRTFSGFKNRRKKRRVSHGRLFRCLRLKCRPGWCKTAPGSIIFLLQ